MNFSENYSEIEYGNLNAVRRRFNFEFTDGGAIHFIFDLNIKNAEASELID